MSEQVATKAVAHPDAEIIDAANVFARYLRIDTFRFRHRLFSGEWSAVRSYDVLRRGRAVAIILYDPDRDSVVLVEQFRLPALLAGSSPWQLEAAAGMIDTDETPEMVAIRETREETGLGLIGEPIVIQRYLPTSGGSDESVVLFCGPIENGHTLIALHWLLRHRDRLQRLWAVG